MIIKVELTSHHELHHSYFEPNTAELKIMGTHLNSHHPPPSIRDFYLPYYTHTHESPYNILVHMHTLCCESNQKTLNIQKYPDSKELFDIVIKLRPAG